MRADVKSVSIVDLLTYFSYTTIIKLLAEESELSTLNDICSQKSVCYHGVFALAELAISGTQCIVCTYS